jgi:4-carboxymuconolactone decarboxylase
MSATATFGRYAEIPLNEMTAEQRDGYKFLVDGPRGRLPGRYKVWVHNPKLLRAAAPLGEHFTPGKSSLTEREREIAVVVITSKWRSAYPAAAHERRGKEVGCLAHDELLRGAGRKPRPGPGTSRGGELIVGDG